MALQGFGIKTIEEFLNSSGSYYIPNYQRDYSWDDKLEVNDLWEDFLTIYEDNVSEYCIGQMVIHNDGTTKNLIDGQQRTATIFLMFLAFRDVLNTVSNSNVYTAQQKDKMGKIASKINNLLKIVDKDDDEDKLFLGENDRNFFREIIYDTAATINKKQTRLSRKKLIKTYNFLYGKFTEKVNSFANTDDSFKFVTNYYAALLVKFKILYVETNDESEAFMIFETLNARGKDLETSDLLKNYFFRTGKNKLADIKDNWNKMSDKLDGYSITTYIRCLWNAKENFCREKLLYRYIKEKCTTTAKCLDFTNDLYAYSDVYLSLIDPKTHIMFESGKNKSEIQAILVTLDTLKVKTYHPLVLSYYIANQSDTNIRDNIYKLLKAIRVLIVRDIVICKGNPNKYEKIFSDLAKKVTDKDIIEVSDIIDVLKDSSVANSTFDAAFLDYKEKGTGSSKDKIRYILRAIIDNNAGPMQVNTNNEKVHIEHIMPQNKAKWTHISDDEHEENLWKIGNLTMLEDSINSGASNDTFDDKKKYYQKSKIAMTYDLASLSKWDVGEINKRQAKLLEEARKLWYF